MHHNAARAILLLGATACLGLACAADPGDPLKTFNHGAPPGGSSSSSGVGGSSSSTGSGASSGSGNGSNGGGNGGSSSGDNGGSNGGASGSSSGGASSSGSSGGASGGSGGADAAPDVAPSGPGCATNPKSAAVAYYTQDMATATAVGTVQFNLQITNAGFATLSLSDVTVRYWFTADGNALSTISFVSYYSDNGGVAITSDVHAAFMPAPPANIAPTSDSYLELSFGTTAGTVSALGSGVAKIQVAFHGPGSSYSDMFNETNDYSFDATKKTTAQPWTNITAYLKGQLVWGCEPGAGGAGSSSSGGGSSGSSGSSSSGGDGGSSSDSSSSGGGDAGSGG